MQKGKILFIVGLIMVLVSCKNSSKKGEAKKIHKGPWRAELNMKGHILPFNFNIRYANDTAFTLEVINADEKIPLTQIKFKNDTMTATFDVFQSYIKARVTDSTMSGMWYNPSKGPDYKIPFNAQFRRTERFVERSDQIYDFSGKWKAVFSPGVKDDQYDAVGIFDQHGDHLTGTFLTTTGDYRYLDGIADIDGLKLSCFDGSHAFLFEAGYKSDTLKGMYYSGIHWEEPWVAVRDSSFELPDPYTLTYLKPGYDKVDFAFPDMDSNIVTLHDEEFKNKVVIIDVMGTWCPNCKDETNFLTGFYKKYKDKGVQIISLCFERTDKLSKAKSPIKEMIAKEGIEYKVLYAGTASKDDASKKLPMLNQIMSYPTTIIIDKRGKVSKIYTGFNGPATGKYYDEFVDGFTKQVEGLLAE